MVSTQQWKVGFVGLGYATSALHVPAAQATDGVVLVGGADSDTSRRAAWQGAGVGPSFSTVEALLDETRPDIVVIATPPHTHASICKMALAAGAHVLCEKPFVETLAQADEVLAAAAGAGRSVAVNHEFRYMPIFSALSEAVGGSGIGKAVFLSCTQFMDLAPWDEPVPWRAAMEHRSLFEGGVHLVDLLHMVAGRSPRSVSAHLSAGLDESQRADAIHLVTLDYGGGLLAQLTINRLCKAGTRYADLRVDCEQASLRASFGGRAFVRVGAKRAEQPGIRVDYGREGMAWIERGLRRRVLARNPARAAARATTDLYRDVLQAWHHGLEAPTAGSVARETLSIIEAAYHSAQTGHPVTPALS